MLQQYVQQCTKEIEDAKTPKGRVRPAAKARMCSEPSVDHTFLLCTAAELDLLVELQALLSMLTVTGR